MKTLMNRALVPLLLALACSSDPSEEFSSACEAKTVRECACPDDSVASQVCSDDGSKWGECSCPPPAEACRRDEDCSDRDFPACIEDECVVPVWVEGGNDCSDPATRCVEGLVCEQVSVEHTVCIVPDDS